MQGHDDPAERLLEARRGAQPITQVDRAVVSAVEGLLVQRQPSCWLGQTLQFALERPGEENQLVAAVLARGA